MDLGDRVVSSSTVLLIMLTASAQNFFHPTNLKQQRTEEQTLNDGQQERERGREGGKKRIKDHHSGDTGQRVAVLLRWSVMAYR